MVFCVRQLFEKIIEYNSFLYVLFVDLKKAYDFISRVVLW